MLNNIFHNLPENSGNEVFQDILKKDNIRIERIVSFGPESNDGEWYIQEENEWVILLKGSAKIIFTEDSVILNSGDYLLINSQQKHKVQILEEKTETIWLAIFF
jgi:cupin 2 domain-containing protein